jgi:hypothetical protein
MVNFLKILLFIFLATIDERNRIVSDLQQQLEEIKFEKYANIQCHATMHYTSLYDGVSCLQCSERLAAVLEGARVDRKLHQGWIL